MIIQSWKIITYQLSQLSSLFCFVEKNSNFFLRHNLKNIFKKCFWQQKEWWLEKKNELNTLCIVFPNIMHMTIRRKKPIYREGKRANLIFFLLPSSKRINEELPTGFFRLFFARRPAYLSAPPLAPISALSACKYQLIFRNWLGRLFALPLIISSLFKTERISAKK